jgi:hypothetical protein
MKEAVVRRADPVRMEMVRAKNVPSGQAQANNPFWHINGMPKTRYWGAASPRIRSRHTTWECDSVEGPSLRRAPPVRSIFLGSACLRQTTEQRSNAGLDRVLITNENAQLDSSDLLLALL